MLVSERNKGNVPRSGQMPVIGLLIVRNRGVGVANFMGRDRKNTVRLRNRVTGAKRSLPVREGMKER
jgi:hypothetical protein